MTARLRRHWVRDIIILVPLLLLHFRWIVALPPTNVAAKYTRRIWQVQDGLPEDLVRAFAQTPDRYLWVGTSAGLVRFDGIKFTIYDRRNITVLRESSILCLLTASNGDLWIGTEGGGLVRYSRGGFTSFSAAQGLGNGFVRSVIQDGMGRFWVGTDGGLFRSNGDFFERIDGTGTIPAIQVHSLFKDWIGRIWVGGTNVLRFDHDRATAFKITGEYSQIRVKSIFVGGDRTTWIGTVSGLYKLSNQDVELNRPFQKVPGVSSTVLSISQGLDSSIWVGTIGEGLFILEGNKQMRLGSPQELPSNTVLDIFEDVERNVWIGTRHGMLRLNKTSVNLIPLPNTDDSDFGTLFQDSNKDLWMASNRLFRIRAGVARQYSFPELSGAHVRNLFRDSVGGLWLGTDGNGVFRISKGRVAHFTSRNGLANNYIRAFLESRDGSIWIATDFGISRWRSGSLSSYQVSDGLVYSNVRVLFEDHSGDLWIGTERGISHMKNGLFLSDGITTALRDEKVWSIDQDQDGDLWFGTRTDGLYRLKGGSVKHFTMKDGLVSDSIYQVVADTNSCLWMSGPDGVSMVRSQDLDMLPTGPVRQVPIRLFGISQGVEMTQIYGGTQFAAVRTNDGIWFPTANGPVRISVAKDSAGGVPPVSIDEVVINGQQEEPTMNTVLKSGNNKLQFNYSTPSLRAPEDMRFRYMLEGFDQNWTDSGSQRQAYYTNLPAGRYKFRVIAFDMDDPSDTSEASLTFEQSPYFYRTWWFISCCFGVAAAVIWMSHLRTLREVGLRFDAVLEERGRVAREMHDTLIQGCVGVSTILEGISSQGGEANDELSSLLNYARIQLRLTLDDARRALWNLRKNETQATMIAPLLISLADEVATEARTKILSDTAGQPYSIATEQARELLMVVREALFNAVHHSNATEIGLQIFFLQDSLEITVRDNGKGFDPHRLELRGQVHYGLIGMKERIQRMNGTFRLSSEPGAGTKVGISVPSKLVEARKTGVRP